MTTPTTMLQNSGNVSVAGGCFKDCGCKSAAAAAAAAGDAAAAAAATASRSFNLWVALFYT